MKQKNQSNMTPEDYFKMQKISQNITQRSGTKTPQEALEVKKRQLKDIQQPKQFTYAKYQEVKELKTKPQITPVPDTAEMPIEDKVSILAKGFVFMNWVTTLLYSAIFILLAVIYPFPFNMVIIAMAFCMDVITWWTMRKYMK